MLHFDEWNAKNEEITVDVAQLIAADQLLKEKNVIIDDTNLGEKHETIWSMLAEQFGAEFVIEEMMDHVSVMGCLNNNEKRHKPVPEHVILNMALAYGYMNMGPVIICDIDGTISDCTHRLHYITETKPKNFKKFFAEMDKDTPKEDVWAEVKREAKKENAEIVLVTARPEEHREVTEQWLRGNGMKGYSHLLMRRTGDKRKDDIVKKEIYERYLQNENVIRAYEDREHIIKMWNELEIPTTMVV
jgi:predicted kinase